MISNLLKNIQPTRQPVNCKLVILELAQSSNLSVSTCYTVDILLGMQQTYKYRIGEEVFLACPRDCYVVSRLALQCPAFWTLNMTESVPKFRWYEGQRYVRKMRPLHTVQKKPSKKTMVYNNKTRSNKQHQKLLPAVKIRNYSSYRILTVRS